MRAKLTVTVGEEKKSYELPSGGVKIGRDPGQCPLATLHGRRHCTMKDVEAVAMPVLRHRVITTFAAEAAGVTSDDLVNMLLKELKPTLDLEI